MMSRYAGIEVASAVGNFLRLRLTVSGVLYHQDFGGQEIPWLYTRSQCMYWKLLTPKDLDSLPDTPYVYSASPCSPCHFHARKLQITFCGLQPCAPSIVIWVRSLRRASTYRSDLFSGLQVSREQISKPWIKGSETVSWHTKRFVKGVANESVSVEALTAEWDVCGYPSGYREHSFQCMKCENIALCFVF